MTAKSRMYISIGFNIISGSLKGYSDLRRAIQKRLFGSRCLGGGGRYKELKIKELKIKDNKYTLKGKTLKSKRVNP